MRLIDADRMAKWFSEGFKPYDSIPIFQVIDGIETRPTEDAIPISWMQKELVEMLYDGEINNAQMMVFHRLIGRWRDECI